MKDCITNKHKNLVSTTQSPKGFDEKFEEWENMLLGEDSHSIRNQICEMIRDAAFFQCINESRKYFAQDDKGNIKQNKMLHYFLNQSFFKTQLLSIRKLVDKDFGRVKKGKKYTVYSLYNLIEDLKKNNALLIRRNILAVNNLPYDYEKADAEFSQNTDWTQGPVLGPREIGFSKLIHERIDSIMRITAEKRNPDDRVLNEHSFKCFDDWLKSSQELYDYVNNYIVHSATPEIRIKVPNELDGALCKIFNAHKVICETASFIGNNLLFCGFGGVLHISQYGRFDQYDLFEYLDEPIASKETIEKLRAFWEKYRRETEQWNR